MDKLKTNIKSTDELTEGDIVYFIKTNSYTGIDTWQKGVFTRDTKGREPSGGYQDRDPKLFLWAIWHDLWRNAEDLPCYIRLDDPEIVVLKSTPAIEVLYFGKEDDVK